MAKTDLPQELASLYKASAKRPALVEVPEMPFLMVDGKGDPESEPFQRAVEALYSLAYTVKFSRKKTGGEDFWVRPLEGLWSVEAPGCWDEASRSAWLWTAMIPLPDSVTPDELDHAREEVARRKELPALDEVRLERWQEGLSAQIMHVGPYAEEPPTIAQLHEFVDASGYRLRGRHHEIYMGDPRRTAPENLKTILRHPVER